MMQTFKITKTDNNHYIIEDEESLNSFIALDEALEQLLYDFEKRVYNTGVVRIGRGKEEADSLRGWKVSNG